MSYTISQVSKKTNLSVHTIRYYDKEGLLPFVDRTKSGNRIFHDQDIEWLDLICCMKNTGMQIKDIRTFIECCKNDDAVMEKSLHILIQHKKNVQQQIKDTQKSLETIEYKIKYLPQMYKDKFSGDYHQTGMY